MNTRTRLLRMELEAFRGFGANQVFDLDADTVLIRGDNGTGKTSVTDGLLWLFTAEIPRLKERGKGIRKAGLDPIVNRYRAGDDAIVKLLVRVEGFDAESDDVTELEFQRVGTDKQSVLLARYGDELVDGEEAEELLGRAFGGFTFAQLGHAVKGWGILQQHALLAALEGGASMHERLAEMVGLERVNRFAKSSSQAVKTLKARQKEVEEVRDRLLERRENAEGSLKTWREQEASRQSEGWRISRLVAQGLEKSEGVVRLKRSVNEIGDLGALREEVVNLGEAATLKRTAYGSLRSSLERSGSSSREIERQLENLKTEADQAIARAPIQVQMADAALQLLGSECPVCGQPIDEDSVQEHLRGLLMAAEGDAQRASDFRRQLSEVEAHLQGVRTAEAERTESEKRLAHANEVLEQFVKEANWIDIESSWLADARAEALLEALLSLGDRIREIQSEARRTGTERVVRWSAEIEAAGGETKNAEAEVISAQAQTDRAIELDKAAHRAAERIVERALQQLQPSLAEVFDRLSPHPTFNELRAEQDIYYGKNQVVPHAYDKEREVGGHPALLFSEGQLNVVALSYFLGLAMNAGDGALPFVVLDDTLAAMDVINVLGFADLCRRLCEKKQLIVTTHDRRFASLLARKLAPREMGFRTVLVELDGWSEQGPIVRVEDQLMAEILPLPLQVDSPEEGQGTLGVG
jgi:DNA repair exonuclease SbcCD ATPase subunit